MLSDVVSFFVAPFAPPCPRKLGKVPDSSILLHRIRTGEIETSDPFLDPSEGLGMVREWIGYKWIYQNTKLNLPTTAPR